MRRSGGRRTTTPGWNGSSPSTTSTPTWCGRSRPRGGGRSRTRTGTVRGAGMTELAGGRLFSHRRGRSGGAVGRPRRPDRRALPGRRPPWTGALITRNRRYLGDRRPTWPRCSWTRSTDDAPPSPGRPGGRRRLGRPRLGRPWRVAVRRHHRHQRLPRGRYNRGHRIAKLTSLVSVALVLAWSWPSTRRVSCTPGSWATGRPPPRGRPGQPGPTRGSCKRPPEGSWARPPPR